MRSEQSGYIRQREYRAKYKIALFGNWAHWIEHPTHAIEAEPDRAEFARLLRHLGHRVTLPPVSVFSLPGAQILNWGGDLDDFTEQAHYQDTLIDLFCACDYHPPLDFYWIYIGPNWGAPGQKVWEEVATPRSGPGLSLRQARREFVDQARAAGHDVRLSNRPVEAPGMEIVNWGRHKGAKYTNTLISLHEQFAPDAMPCPLDAVAVPVLDPIRFKDRV